MKTITGLLMSLFFEHAISVSLGLNCASLKLLGNAHKKSGHSKQLFTQDKQVSSTILRRRSLLLKKWE